MTKKITLNLKHNDSEVLIGASTYEIARSMGHDNEFLADLIDEYLNKIGRGMPEGVAVGKFLMDTHPASQRTFIAFCLGAIIGISNQSHTDPRNETAIAAAKKISDMYANGDIEIGMYI